MKTKHFTNRKNADEEEEKFGDTVLFSGDTLAHQLPSTFSSIFPPSPAFAEKDEDEEQYKLGKLLTGFKAFNHGSIRKQEDTIRSLASNRKFPFTWLLPAHGRMIRFTSLEEKQQAILEATELFHEEDETTGSLGLHNYYS